MHESTIRVIAVIAVAVVTTVAVAHRANAGGVQFIEACTPAVHLDQANTTYKVTSDLTSCGDCLIVDADRITIDLQGHSMTNTCPGSRSGITDNQKTRTLITVKNGFITGYGTGVDLGLSSRVSVLGVTAQDNAGPGILTGPRALVKACEASGNFGGVQVGARSQVQQCYVHDNQSVGILAFPADNCLITMNIANNNGFIGGIVTFLGDRCTVSYNTVRNNIGPGVDAGASTGGSGHLVTHNTALQNNGGIDYEINCPSTATYNDSTNGFPASYSLVGTGCHTANNN